MCEPEESKSNYDLNSDSSWSVIEESESSGNPSSENLLENVVIEESKVHLEPFDNNIEGTFVNVPNVVVNETVESTSDRSNGYQPQNKPSETGKSKVHKCKFKRHKKNKPKPDALSLFAIAASILTITGITLLCTLFPHENEVTYDTISRNHLNVNIEKNRRQRYSSYDVPTYNYSQFKNINHFPEITERNISEVYSSDEGICSMDDHEVAANNIEMNPIRFDNKPLMAEFSHDIEDFEREIGSLIDIDSFRNVTKKFMSGLKEAFSNGSLHVLICALMQDLCLIKLMRQMNKQNDADNQSQKVAKPRKVVSKQNKPKSSNQLPKTFGKNFTNKLNEIIEKKLKDLETPGSKSNHHKKNKNPELSITTPCIISNCSDSQIIEKLNRRYKNDTEIKNRENENGKSECQRRFEDLDNEWETLGQNHRLKIQEIKERFKNEIHLVKENEFEDSTRKKRMKLIREKYLERLKNDREKYLLQLNRLRDERHTMLKGVCQQQNLILDYKDAGVGNYAVVIPETYDFEQNLKTLKQKEQAMDQMKVTLGQVPLSSIKNSTPTTQQTLFPNTYRVKKNESDDMIWQHKVPKATSYQKYGKPFELAQKALKKRRSKLKTKNKENAMKPLIEDMVTKMISSISESISKFQENDTISDTSALVYGNTSDYDSRMGKFDSLTNDYSEHKFKFVIKSEVQPKTDIYTLAFGENATKIKEVESAKWTPEKKRTKPPLQMQILSKQDPKKSHKEKIMFKGLM